MLTDSTREKSWSWSVGQLRDVGRQLCQRGETQRQLCILQNGDEDGEVEQLLVLWQHELGLLLQRPGQFGLLQLGQHRWQPSLARCRRNRHTANTLHYHYPPRSDHRAAKRRRSASWRSGDISLEMESLQSLVITRSKWEEVQTFMA